jgi:hypothetical protein
MQRGRRGSARPGHPKEITMKRFAVLAVAGLLSLALGACSKDEQPASVAAIPADPAATIEKTAADLRSGDLLAAVRTVVPPAHYERMRIEWRTRMAAEPPSDAERAQFAATMTKLTAPDAEAQLYAEFEPQLAQYESEMAAQMPLMVGMGRGFAMQSLQQSETLTAEQKKQAGELLDAVANWLQSARFFDRDLARQAIARIVATARALDLQTLDQVQALEFEQAMQKGGIALRGAFDVLGIYGLKLDDALASVDATTLSQQDETARVKVDYAVFGQPLSLETEMVRIDDRWYGKDAVVELERAASAPPQPADDGSDPDEVDAEAEADLAD